MINGLFQMDYFKYRKSKPHLMIYSKHLTYYSVKKKPPDQFLWLLTNTVKKCLCFRRSGLNY
jgi:hypothetical protein